ncbi:carboxylate-amine ligase [Nocardioides jensenii]|uniref:carboxylate-amine ligase n=1 Tax=Nocardioides jensenii TaxID=1843 RepID=UPI00082EA343|nr:glutamate--cysteine ligase [Nocardioides jensenii]
MNELSETGTPLEFRTVGVEEELLLVDAETGAPRSVASHVLRVAHQRGDTEADADDVGGSVGPELQEQQVETDTPPEEDLGLLEIEIGRWREKARAAAAETGTLVLASGTTPLPVRPRTFDDERYSEMTERFGLTASEQLTCGCHVHVSVTSDDEAIGALDRIRVWLPVLLAISANSPFWQGTDSGYESYRSQALTRWPTNGPTHVFGSGRAYTEHLRQLTDTGVPLDEGMAYFDARPSRRYPTLEIRVADVCLDPRDAVLVAALARALVSTGASEWRRGVEPDPASVAVLRLAMWQAGKHGTSGDLLDPVTHRPRAAHEVVDSLVAHVATALGPPGDLDRVEEGVRRLFSRGTGAARQRKILAEEGRLDRAVLRLAHLT